MTTYRHNPTFDAACLARTLRTSPASVPSQSTRDFAVDGSSRVCFAVLLSVAFLLLAVLAEDYLPGWLSLLAVPASLSGGAFVLSGLLIGLLLAVCAVTCLTGLFYFAFWAYAEMNARGRDSASPVGASPPLGQSTSAG
jgi:hypothetical protein